MIKRLSLSQEYSFFAPVSPEHVLRVYCKTITVSGNVHDLCPGCAQYDWEEKDKQFTVKFHLKCGRGRC
ncbi:hypothetical protein MHYP_G00329620 [Metynnis hypsauchen]